jgi:hypothetical protein
MKTETCIKNRVPLTIRTLSPKVMEVESYDCVWCVCKLHATCNRTACGRQTCERLHVSYRQNRYLLAIRALKKALNMDEGASDRQDI